ncbi:MAG: methyltransferase domain-containing protein, partial [bacterium]
LLIEAGLEYPSLEKLIGFDNDKKNISLAIQNIKKAGLIRKIQLSEKDVMTKPEIGKFDVITSDLPFGMIVSKNKDLEVLYKNFIECAKTNLNKDGILVTYTSEYEMFEKIIKGSEFTILSNFNLKFVTNANSNLKTRILVCKFK